MSRIWRTDGPETKQLEKLFRDKVINYNSKPQTVQNKYPMFKDFSAPVFRKNFNLAKQKCCPKPVTFDDDEVPSLLDIINAEEQESERIAELDGVQGPSEKKPKVDNEAGEKGKSVKTDRIPLVATVYTNPETKSDVCIVVALLYGGVKGVNIDVISNPEGTEQTLKIEYAWPKSMHDMSTMFFDDEMDEMMYDISTPRVQAVENALKAYRKNVEEAPVAKMELKLPIEVDANPQTWAKTYNKKADGGVVMYLEFNAIRKNYSIAKNEKYLKIE